MTAQPRFQVGDRVVANNGFGARYGAVVEVSTALGYRVQYVHGGEDWRSAEELKHVGLPTPAPTPDPVNHPPHYTQGGVECIDAIRAALGREGFVAHCRGTAIKYIWRAGLKGPAAEDLDKAIWYLKRARAEMGGGE